MGRRRAPHKEPVKLSDSTRAFLNMVVLRVPFEERVRSFDDAVIWLSQNLTPEARAKIMEKKAVV